MITKIYYDIPRNSVRSAATGAIDYDWGVGGGKDPPLWPLISHGLRPPPQAPPPLILSILFWAIL